MSGVMCGHCGTPISDRSTMVQRRGRTYCCSNCTMMAESQTPKHTNKTMCSHCDMPIVDTSTQVERHGQSFCCVNCVNAKPGAAGTPRRAGRAS